MAPVTLRPADPLTSSLGTATYQDIPGVPESKRFAAAIGIEVPSLQPGTEYIAASGNVERSLGVTRLKLKFTLGRGTTNSCEVELQVTIVDTTA